MTIGNGFIILEGSMALFVSLIIRTFQLVFSAGTLFFSHNKSAGTVFRLVFSAKRTGPMYLSWQFLFLPGMPFMSTKKTF